ncbi:MAG: S8 family serine peptidase [Gemmatimonadaceae bacterium]|nr:S8 family serine peptidase [Gemmatimonadaceae bacterium]
MTDQNGQPFPNVTVTFAVTAGGGSLTPATATTDAQGTARTTLTLGPSVGVNTITASALRDGTPLIGSPLSLSATADDGAIIAGQVSIARGSLLGFSTFGSGAGTGALTVRGMTMGATDELPLAEVPADRYVVHVRRDAVALPGVQEVSAWQSRATVRDAVAELTSVMAPFARDGVAEIIDVSPVLGAMRVRITDPAGIAHGVQQLAASDDVLAVTREVVGRIDDYATAPIESSKFGAVIGGGMSQVLPTQTLPNDPLLPAQFWPLAMIEAPRAWRVQQGSLSVVVAVIDNGARFDHPAMAGVYTNDGYNFMSGLRLNVNARAICGGGTLDNLDTVRDTTFTGYRADPTQLDDYTQSTAGCWQRSTGGGHGLHVAGTIGALGGDSVGTTGVAQRVRIRPVRACGVTPACGTDFDLAQAILYAAGLPASDGRGGTVPVVPRAAVANMSLGGYADTPVLREAITAASATGILLIASAGNAPTAANFLPAAYPTVVSVAALGPDGNLTDYTTIGTTIDLASPGGTFRFGVGSTGIASTTYNFVARAANYTYYSGTSMAAPHVTGVAALIAAQNPSFTATQIRARLEQTATDMGAPGRDNVYGFGLVNARAALTGSMPSTATVVKLLNASTGDSVAAVVAGADGAYRFARLTPGWIYSVISGQDEENDRRAGLPGRRFGWHGGARPTDVTIAAGQAPVAASFQVGLPVEAEPNNEAATANPIFLNAWAAGSIGPLDPADFYRVRVPRSGSYVIETFGIGGSCGYGLELDTVLDATDALGANVLATNDDTVFPGSQFCSRVTRTAEAGATIVFRVRGFSQVSAGQYRVTVRPAN